MGLELPDVVRSVGYGIALIALPWILATVLTRSSGSKGMSWKSLFALLVLLGSGFAGYKLYQGDWMLPAGVPTIGERSAAFSFEREASVIGGGPLTHESIPAFARLIVQEFAQGSGDGTDALEARMHLRLLSVDGARLLHASNARYGSLEGQYYAGHLGTKLRLVFCVADSPEHNTLEDAACREEVEWILGLPVSADAIDARE